MLAFFNEEAASVPRVKDQMADAPRLAVMQERADQLTRLCGIAQQAIGYLGNKAQAPSGWKQASLAEIENAKKRSAIVQFVFLQPLTDLVNAVR